MIRPFWKAALPLSSALICGLLAISSANAQAPTLIDGIDISINPQNPVPGRNVDISVQSYLSDINSAFITWVLNGKKAAEGVGRTGISITAPPLGKTSSVTILISTEDGKSIQKSLVIKSGSVDLVWESQGYAPPMYQGKQPFAYENAVKVVALPHLANSSGKEIDPSTLVYSWKNGDSVLQDKSGYGKQAVTVVGSVIPRPMQIHVDVSTRDGSQTASGDLTLEAGSPSILFYREDPLYGVLYNAALGSTVSFANRELTLLAAPYSFNMPAAGKKDLKYAWTINGQDQGGLSSNRSVTLRVQDTAANGSYPVQLQLQNLRYILEGAGQGITVMFRSTKNTNATRL